MKLLFKTLTVLFLSVIAAEAQTVVTKGPFDTSMKVTWEMPDYVTTPADALTYEPRLKDSVGPFTLTLTGNSCSPGLVNPALITCISPLTPGLVTQLNKPGTHSLTLSIFRTDMGDSPASVPFTLVGSSPPLAAPTNFRIIK